MNNTPKVKVIGVGGAGCNTISRLSLSGLNGLDMVAVNTDIQALNNCSVAKKILIGEKITGGMGAGMDYKLGEKAAKESYEALKEAISGSEIVFLTAGLGGGCLRGSSSVFTNPEGPVRIDSIKPGATVYTFSDNTLKKKKGLGCNENRH